MPRTTAASPFLAERLFQDGRARAVALRTGARPSLPAGCRALERAPSPPPALQNCSFDDTHVGRILDHCTRGDHVAGSHQQRVDAAVLRCVQGGVVECEHQRVCSCARAMPVSSRARQCAARRSAYPPSPHGASALGRAAGAGRRAADPNGWGQTPPAPANRLASRTGRDWPAAVPRCRPPRSRCGAAQRRCAACRARER